MPRKKGGRSGTPDGYAPSPLGVAGVDSPRAADSASDLGADLVAPPVPGWSGLSTRVPCGAPFGATLEPTPVATGIGSHVHALLSPKLMTNAGLGAGDWVALAVVESPAAVRAAGGAGTSTPARGGGVGGGGTPSSTNGANTPRTPLSRSSSVAGDAPRTPRGAGADRPPSLDAPAALIPALLARNVALDVAPPDAFADPADTTDATLAAAAAAAAPDALGRFTVLARVHPNPKASAPSGTTLARKIWMSLGSPPGGAGIHVYPLEGPSAIPEISGISGDGNENAVVTARAPTPGATCASATLRLWAVEGDASRGDWLRRGLAPGAGPRQRAVLEALARRALDGRCLLPGNLARLPLLGTSAYFLVEDVGLRPGTVDREKTSVTLKPRDDAGEGAGAGSGSEDAGSDSEDDDSGSDSDDVAAAAARRARRAADRLGVGGFASLGGVGEHAAALHELVELPLRRPELFESCGVRPPRGVLLWGPPGTGKTRLARAAASAAGATLMVVRGPELIGAHVGESEAALRGVFAAASEAAPCVVLLDELDAIAPARSGGDGLGARGGDGGGADEAMSARIVAALLSVLDGAGADAVSLHRVVVVATTNRPEAIDRALRRPGRFDREIEVGAPTPAGRREILDAHLRGVRHELTDAQAATLAADAHGFVGADVAALCRGAAMEALRRRVREKTTTRAEGEEARARRDGDGDGDTASAASAASLADRMDGLSVSSPSDERSGRVERSDAPSTVTWDDFLAARVRVRPSALREVAVEVPKVAWDDVGGLGDVKQRLKEAVEWSERHPDAMSRVGAKPPKGILLYGPPGCSKTMLARAVASASGRNFLTVKGPELYSKWVGDSEKAVRSLFARARASAPSVVFLDELDGLVGARSSGGGEGPSVHDRLLTQLLSEMDGLQTGRGDASDAVAVVAATNRPDLVDAALLRPGRFDRLLFIPPPRAAEDRAEILRVKLRRTPVGADVNLDMLATATHGYTGADLAAVCREAALAALEENIDAKEVCARHFAAATGRTPPSPPPAKELAEVYAKFARPGAGLAAV